MEIPFRLVNNKWSSYDFENKKHFVFFLAIKSFRKNYYVVNYYRPPISVNNYRLLMEGLIFDFVLLSIKLNRLQFGFIFPSIYLTRIFSGIFPLKYHQLVFASIHQIRKIFIKTKKYEFFDCWLLFCHY